MARRFIPWGMEAALSGLVDEALAGAADLGEEIVALAELIHRPKAALVDRVAVFDADGGWEADGVASFACWLRARATSAEARRSSCAGSPTRCSRCRAALESGKLSVTKARLLAEVVNPRTRDRCGEQETFLIDQVQGLDVDASARLRRPG